MKHEATEVSLQKLANVLDQSDWVQIGSVCANRQKRECVAKFGMLHHHEQQHTPWQIIILT